MTTREKENQRDAFFVGVVVGFLLCAALVYATTRYFCERTTECKSVDGIEVCRTITYGSWNVKGEE